MNTIVVAVDNSTGSDAALEAAVQLALESGAELRCVGVDDSLATAGIDPAPAQAAEAAAGAGRDAGVAATAESRIGPAAERIIDAANECNADLIVVGSRGRGWLKAAVLGSVSAAVVRNSSCPVLVVKEARTRVSAPDASPAPASRSLFAVGLPGMAPTDVHVELDGGTVVVTAQHSTTAADAAGSAEWQQRVHARFALPAGVDPDDVTAEFGDGVLTVLAATAPVSGRVAVPVATKVQS
jgi:nucleotide-binding universal stress UspA family protein